MTLILKGPSQGAPHALKWLATKTSCLGEN